ncbi:MAG: twin-arginine translocase subunit TatC [Candidatus Limnocylindria bacterium]
MTNDGALDSATMSLLEHLEELRSRIIIVAVTIAVAGIAGFLLSDPLIELLMAPLPDDADVIQTAVGEAFGVRLQLALMSGVALAVPVILYEVWAFVTPGLTRSERRLVWPLLGVAIVLFVAGLAFGYLLIPLAVNFLLGFTPEEVPQLLRLGDYIDFVSTFLLAFGIAMQFPVVLFLLARIGVLSYAFLSSRRRWVVLLIALFAILVTPGDIVIGSGALALILYALFEATLQLIRIMGR